MYGIVLDKQITVDNRTIQKRLSEEGIGSRTFFGVCISNQYIRRGIVYEEVYPNAEYLARKGFYIPSGLALRDEQMERVVAGVRKVIAEI